MHLYGSFIQFSPVVQVTILDISFKGSGLWEEVQSKFT